MTVSFHLSVLFVLKVSIVDPMFDGEHVPLDVVLSLTTIALPSGLPSERDGLRAGTKPERNREGNQKTTTKSCRAV
jgi:hypothetical protein